MRVRRQGGQGLLLRMREPRRLRCPGSGRASEQWLCWQGRRRRRRQRRLWRRRLRCWRQRMQRRRRHRRRRQWHRRRRLLKGLGAGGGGCEGGSWAWGGVWAARRQETRRRWPGLKSASQEEDLKTVKEAVGFRVWGLGFRVEVAAWLVMAAAAARRAGAAAKWGGVQEGGGWLIGGCMKERTWA